MHIKNQNIGASIGISDFIISNRLPLPNISFSKIEPKYIITAKLGDPTYNKNKGSPVENVLIIIIHFTLNSTSPR